MTDWKKQGFLDARDGKDAILPTERKTSLGEHLAWNLLLPGLGTAVSMLSAADDREKNDDADNSYIDGYRSVKK